MQTTEHRLFAGVDGGGTRCRLRLRRPDGRSLAEGLGGRANLYTSVEETRESILAAATSALAAAGLGEEALQRIHCGLGLAGGQMQEAAHALIRQLPFASALVVTDGEAALAGAFGGQDGAIAIFGTGSAYLARRGAVLRAVGGHGFHVGDTGSGADLGRRALALSLHAHDGVVASSGLTEAVLSHFGGEPLTLIRFARDATPAAYGAFAPLVFDHADLQDPHARMILSEVLVTITASLHTITAGLDRLCLLGGLALRYRPFLEPRFGDMLREPQSDAMDGAILLAKGALV